MRGFKYAILWRNNKTSVFLDRDLSRAETQSRGEGVGRKERIDRKDWKCVKLGEFELHRNNTCARSLMTSDNGKMQNIHYGDILVKFNEIVSLEQTKIDYLTAEGENCAPKDYIQNGDIVIADTAEDETVGKMIEVQDVGQHKVVAGLHTIFYRPPSNLFARGWLGYWMNSTAYHSQLNQYMTGIKVLSLSKSCLANTLIQYPPKKEQQQIVAALDSVQRHITSLQALVAKYDAVKKATVNLLLKAKVGWRKVKVKDFCPLQRGFDLPKRLRREGKYPLVCSNGVVDRIDTALQKAPGVVTGRSGTIGSVHYVTEDYWPHNTTLWVTKFIDADPMFVYHLLSNMNLTSFSGGSGVPTLNRNNIHETIISVPTIHKQREIAAQISAIDNMIKICHAQLAKAQSLKHGMMTYFFG